MKLLGYNSTLGVINIVRTNKIEEFLPPPPPPVRILYTKIVLWHPPHPLPHFVHTYYVNDPLACLWWSNGDPYNKLFLK